MSDTDQLALTEYLSTSAAAGLLRQVDGAHYVAAEQVEPNTGERYCFVEFADTPLLTSPELRGAFLLALATEFPWAESAVVCTSAHADLDLHWQRLLTYFLWTPGRTAPARPSQSLVRPATDLELPRLVNWLTRSFTRTAPQRAQRASDPAKLASGILAEPDRRSWISWAGAEAVGHATVLTSALDLIRGQTFIELLDILVEPTRDDRRERTLELLATVQNYAEAARKPLLSNVVHLSGDLEAASRDWQVAGTLHRTGWTEHDVYYCAELPSEP
ncbi:MAG TPA: hypothetical protein VH008_35435 [Pseudonocardia sp.]|nr:hypothetical protein [Pseudonocardia sp.]